MNYELCTKQYTVGARAGPGRPGRRGEGRTAPPRALRPPARALQPAARPRPPAAGPPPPSRLLRALHDRIVRLFALSHRRVGELVERLVRV